jgi:hypothetical protein
MWPAPFAPDLGQRQKIFGPHRRCERIGMAVFRRICPAHGVCPCQMFNVMRYAFCAQIVQLARLNNQMHHDMIGLAWHEIGRAQGMVLQHIKIFSPIAINLARAQQCQCQNQSCGPVVYAQNVSPYGRVAVSFYVDKAIVAANCAGRYAIAASGWFTRGFIRPSLYPNDLRLHERG